VEDVAARSIVVGSCNDRLPRRALVGMVRSKTIVRSRRNIMADEGFGKVAGRNN